MKNIIIQFKFLLIILSSIFLLSCSGGSSVSGGDSFPSVLPEDPTAGFDNDNFYIAVRNTSEVASHFRTLGSFGTRCEITEGSANQDLTCIVDIPEGDLYFHGLEFVYNVPENMCRYLSRQTYWYYNNEVGYGPRNVDISVTLNASNAITSSTCNIDGVISTPCNPTLYPELNFTTSNSDISVSCAYDRSLADEPNCCFGDYSLRNTRITPTSTEITTSQNTWGDPSSGMKSCLGGPGRTNWLDYSSSGFPSRLIVSADDGLSGTYELPAPIQTPNTGFNSTIANYYTPAAVHSHVSFGTATVSQLPYFIEPLTDRSGTSVATGNDSYEFMCMDEAFEVRHRIRVYVREWDAYSDYLAYIASSGVTVVPDRPLDTDVACDGVIGNCNDNYDLDDYPRILQGIIGVAAPANEYYDQVGEEVLRYYNFPADEYSN